LGIKKYIYYTKSCEKMKKFNNSKLY